MIDPNFLSFLKLEIMNFEEDGTIWNHFSEKLDRARSLENLQFKGEIINNLGLSLKNAQKDQDVEKIAFLEEAKKIAFLAERTLFLLNNKENKVLTEDEKKDFILLMELSKEEEKAFIGSDGTLSNYQKQQIEKTMQDFPDFVRAHIEKNRQLLNEVQDSKGVDPWAKKFIAYAINPLTIDVKTLIENDYIEQEPLTREEKKAFAVKIRPFFKRWFKELRKELGKDSFDIESMITKATKHRYFVSKLENILQTKKAPNPTDPWTQSFVKWALRSGCDIEVYIKCPLLSDILMEHILDKNSGVIHKDQGIKFMDWKNKRTVCIRADLEEAEEGWIPIKTHAERESTYVLRSRSGVEGATGHAFKVSEMFTEIKKKMETYTNVNYGKEGLINWNAINLGSLNKEAEFIPLNVGSNFLQSLPIALEVTNLDLLKERYPCQRIDENCKQFLAVRANRDEASQALLGTHGFFDVVIKNQKGGYDIYPFGSQPKELRMGKEQALLFGTSQEAALHYIDDNTTMTARQHLGEIFAISEEGLKRGIQWLKMKYDEGKSGCSTFMLQGTNCAALAQEALFVMVLQDELEKVEQIAEKIFGSKRVMRPYTLWESFWHFFEGDFEDGETFTVSEWIRKGVIDQDDKALDFILNSIVKEVTQSEYIDNLIDIALSLIEKTEDKEHTKLKEAAEIIRDKIKSSMNQENIDINFIELNLQLALKNLLIESVRSGQVFRASLIEDSDFHGKVAGLAPIINWIRSFRSQMIRNFLTTVLNTIITFLANVLFGDPVGDITEFVGGNSPALRKLSDFPGYENHIVHLPPRLYKWSEKKNDPIERDRYIEIAAQAFIWLEQFKKAAKAAAV